MKANFKPLALALALGVIGAEPAQAGSYNSKRATNHTHSASASVSVPAFLVFGQAISSIAGTGRTGVPNSAWIAQIAPAFRAQRGWKYEPFAPDSGWQAWAEGKARATLFANLWLSKLAPRLRARTYQSPHAVVAEATRLLEHTDPAQIRAMWALTGRAVDQAAKNGGLIAVSDSSSVHFILGGATYLGGQGGWSIVRNGGIWFGSASGGQERIAGNTYSLEVRNGDELSHGTDQSQAVFGGN